MLTIKDVAKTLKLHEMTVYRYVVSGKIKSVKFGNTYRITEEEVEKIKKDGLSK